MSEMENVQSQDTQISSPVTSSPAPVETHQQQSSSEEKLLRQSEVNDIVGRAKHEAVERYKRSEQSQQPAHQNYSINQDEVRRLAEEEVNRSITRITQENQQRAVEQDAQRIAGEFFTKLSTGKEKYSDFEQVTGDVEYKSIPNIVQLANMFDNTADLMYDIAKNPSKIATIQQLMGIDPKMAYREMQRLSQSIKDNESAGKVKLPNDPLSQLKPTNAGTENGEMSINDARQKYRA